MKITISPRVIKHLGKDLITSSEVAVVELIKNSIDAKARNINLRIYDSLPNNVELTTVILNNWLGTNYIDMPMAILEDDGHGMTDSQLVEGFLTVGTEIKEDDNTVLGAKGIGRLAAQRLGCAVLLETCSADETHTSYVLIDWNRVIQGDEIVPYLQAQKTEPHTRLWIFGIKIEDYI